MAITRVPLILEDKVRLINLTADLRDKLIAAGFEVIPDGYGYPSVKYEPVKENITLNQSLISLLSYLAGQGVAFERDHKQAYPPSYAIQHLREHGLYKGEIIICGFNGSDWEYEVL
jgi:hypothetical protein